MSLPASGHAYATSAASRRRFSGLLCLTLLMLFFGGIWHLTRGLTVWTFEDWRQQQIAQGALQAQMVNVRGLSPTWLWAPRRADPVDQIYLVDFIYTRCPTVCRTLGSEFQQMQRALMTSKDPRSTTLRLVSMSFDVDRDDAHVLKQYAAQMRADPKWWQLGIPASQTDAEDLLRSLGVVVIPDGQDGFVHNGAIHVLDAQGRLLGLYEPGQWQEALNAAHHWAGRRAGGAL